MNEQASVKKDSAFTYLALGDSYTIGEAVDANERFPVQAIHWLGHQDIYFDPPEIIATTGWTTTELLKALNAHPPKNKYTIVSLLIGVNNQYRHTGIDEYKTEFTELLNRSVAYAGDLPQHVFVLSVPDYSVTPFAANMDISKIAKEIDEFNVVNKTISLHAGVHYIDVTTISRQARSNPSLTAGDGLHPSALQYSWWSSLLAGAIKEILR